MNSSADHVGDGVQKDQHMVCGRKRKENFLAEFCPTQKSLSLPFCSSAAGETKGNLFVPWSLTVFCECFTSAVCPPKCPLLVAAAGMCAEDTGGCVVHRLKLDIYN